MGAGILGHESDNSSDDEHLKPEFIIHPNHSLTACAPSLTLLCTRPTKANAIVLRALC